MIKSLQKIEHVLEGGDSTVLLEFGDYIEEEIEIGVEQQNSEYFPIGAIWGLGLPEGGARRSFTFSRRLDHASHSRVRSWCFSHPETIPFSEEGSVRVSIRDAEDSPIEVWLMESAVIKGCAARPLDDTRNKFSSLTTYQVSGGRMYPIEGDFGHCDPIGWQTYIISDDDYEIGSDACELDPPYVPPAPTPGTPPSLVPAGRVLGFTVSGITSPAEYNGHYMFSGYAYGQMKWHGPAGSKVVKVGSGSSWDMGSGGEPDFYTTDSPEFPWLGTWAVNLGTGIPILTPDA